MSEQGDSTPAAATEVKLDAAAEQALVQSLDSEGDEAMAQQESDNLASTAAADGPAPAAASGSGSSSLTREGKEELWLQICRDYFFHQVPTFGKLRSHDTFTD